MYFEYAVYGFSIVLCAYFSFRVGFRSGFQDGVQGAMEHIMSDEFMEGEDSDESPLMRVIEVDDDGNETKSYFKEF